MQVTFRICYGQGVADEPGLRQRKRRAAMTRVQQVALDLFDARGFDAVTIEQVAAAAEVSPSSVYRYFGTKAGLVLVDADRRPEPAARRLPAAGDQHPVDLARHAVREYLGEQAVHSVNRRRVQYLMEVPAVQAELSQRMFDRLRELAAGAPASERAGAAHFEAQTTWGAIYGTLLGAVTFWYSTDCADPLLELVEDALARLRRGLGDQHVTGATPPPG